MRVSAKADYAVRAAVELAANANDSNSPMKGERISDAQGIPLKFLEYILVDLRVADVFRAAEGPLASVRGEKPEELDYAGNAEALRDVWVALRASLRDVLEHVTLADIAAGKLPKQVSSLTSEPGAWQRR